MAEAAQHHILQLQSLQEDTTKLIDWTTKITAQWEDYSLPEAAILGRDIQHLFHSVSQQLTGEAPKGSAPELPPSAANVTAQSR